MVADTANAANWSVQSNLQVGAKLYGDRTYTLVSLPSPLRGTSWIRTANSSKQATNNPLVTFILTRQADVYVALDLRLGNPPRRSWMDATWSDTSLDVLDTESGTQQTFRLYKKTFPPGPVALGSNASATLSSMYTVIVL